MAFPPTVRRPPLQRFRLTAWARDQSNLLGRRHARETRMRAVQARSQMRKVGAPS